MVIVADYEEVNKATSILVDGTTVEETDTDDHVLPKVPSNKRNGDVYQPDNVQIVVSKSNDFKRAVSIFGGKVFIFLYFFTSFYLFLNNRERKIKRLIEKIHLFKIKGSPLMELLPRLGQCQVVAPYLGVMKVNKLYQFPRKPLISQMLKVYQPQLAKIAGKVIKKIHLEENQEQVQTPMKI